jgi:hypothetical protein
VLFQKCLDESKPSNYLGSNNGQPHFNETIFYFGDSVIYAKCYYLRMHLSEKANYFYFLLWPLVMLHLMIIILINKNINSHRFSEHWISWDVDQVEVTFFLLLCLGVL